MGIGVRKALGVVGAAWMAAAGLGLSQARAAQANLIDNGGLEQALADTGLPAGWGFFGKPLDAYKFAVADGGRTGKALSVFGAGDYGGVGTTRKPIEPGKLYRAAGWIKVEGKESAKAMIKFDFFDDKGEYVGSREAGALDPKTPGWQPMGLSAASATAPEKAKALQVTCVLMGEGKAWFDDLSLSVAADDGKNLALNGSFEDALGERVSDVYLALPEGEKGVKALSSTDKPQDGLRCLRLVGMADWAVAVTPRVKIAKGKTYTLVGYARVAKGATKIKFDYFKNGEYLGSTESDECADANWTKLSVDSQLGDYPEADEFAPGGVGVGEMDVCFDAFLVTAK